MQAKLIEWVEIAPGVRHFVFEAPQLERLEFVPGQFVSLSDSVASRDITRAYSIASAPEDAAITSSPIENVPCNGGWVTISPAKLLVAA